MVVDISMDVRFRITSNAAVNRSYAVDLTVATNSCSAYSMPATPALTRTRFSISSVMNIIPTVLNAFLTCSTSVKRCI